MKTYIVDALIQIQIEIEDEKDIKEIIQDEAHVPFEGVTGKHKDNWFNSETMNTPLKVIRIVDVKEVA